MDSLTVLMNTKRLKALKETCISETNIWLKNMLMKSMTTLKSFIRRMVDMVKLRLPIMVITVFLSRFICQKKNLNFKRAYRLWEHSLSFSESLCSGLML